jgi:hypothetical protein
MNLKILGLAQAKEELKEQVEDSNSQKDPTSSWEDCTSSK